MFRTRYAFCLLGLLLLTPEILLSQDSQPDFDAFFANFKVAVTKKDTATLTSLMSPHFSFIRAENVSPSVVFKALDADQGRQWTNLQQSVQQPAIPYQPKGTNTTARALQCTPTDSTYNCLVILQQDKNQHWRWKGMIMPTRY
jgi:hypothetical protein